MRKIFILLLALIMCLSLFACGKINKEEAISQLTNHMRTLVELSESGDIVATQEKIDAIRTMLSGSHSHVKKDFEKIWEETYWITLEDTLDDIEQSLTYKCVNNTSISLPQYVLNMYESKGSWLVNDHGDFATYNWQCTSMKDLYSAYEYYKRYVSRITEITDSGDYFGFSDNSGNTVTVRRSYNSKSSTAILQVVVPKF